MKQIVLLIYVLLTIFIVQCTSFVSPYTMVSSLNNDIMLDNQAEILKIPRTDLVDCYNKANIEPLTVLSFMSWIQCDILNNITNTEETGLKVGCFNACITQKSLLNVHPERYLALIMTVTKISTYLKNSFITSDMRNRTMDCLKKIPTRNECEMHYETMLCQKYLIQQLQDKIPKNYE